MATLYMNGSDLIVKIPLTQIGKKDDLYPLSTLGGTRVEGDKGYYTVFFSPPIVEKKGMIRRFLQSNKDSYYDTVGPTKANVKNFLFGNSIPYYDSTEPISMANYDGKSAIVRGNIFDSSIPIEIFQSFMSTA